MNDKQEVDMRAATIWLRAIIGFFLLVAVLFQTWAIPGFTRDLAMVEPEFQPIIAPTVVGGIVLGLCAEVALIAMWVLAGRAESGRIFEASSLKWITSMIWAAFVSAFVPIVAVIWFGALQLGGPQLLYPAVMMAGLLVLFGIALIIMRSLLKQASDVKQELAEVI